MNPTPSTPPTTLQEALDRAAAAATPLAFIDRRERRRESSWSEVRRRSRALAAGLRARGIEPGERIGLVYPTGPEFFDALFGSLLAGAVPVPLYPPVRLGRVDDYRRRTLALLERVAATTVLAEPRTGRILAGSGDERLAVLDVGDLLAVPAPPARHAARPRDLALIQFSSGTTSDPKPAALSHRALLAQVAALSGFWPPSDDIDHAGLSWLPLYHDMGLVGCVLGAVARPGPLTLMPPELFIARPAAWLRAISATRATVSPAPTFAFGHCVDRVRDDELAGVDLSSWRFALCGAETVVPEVLERFAERFSRWGFRRQALTPSYGLAEAALAVTFSRPGRGVVARRFARRPLAVAGRAEEDPGGMAIASLGAPLPGFAVEIRDGGGRRLASREVGRVWVRGPSLMDGYLDDPQATGAALVDGWLDTGDLGFLLDGELHLTGRARDVLILRGRNHSPEEVERAVSRVPGVAAGGVAAVSHRSPGEEGERLFVFVESARGHRRRTDGALVEACRRELLAATGLAADSVVVFPAGELPRTSSGKIRRRAALERHLSASAASAASTAAAATTAATAASAEAD